ncbi:MAG: hypothetical protein AAFU79_15075 [Myxococcota bacterium]
MAIAAPVPLDHSHAQAELGVFTTDGDSAFVTTLSGRVAATRLLAFELDIPFVATTGSPGNTVFGNVGFRALARTRIAKSTVFEGGLGVAAGTAEADDFGEIGTYSVATAMTGYRRSREFVPGGASVYLPVRFESAFRFGLFIRNQAAFDVIFPTDSDRGDPLIQLTWEGGPGYRSGIFEAHLAVGVAGLFPTGSGSSDGQVTLIPRVRVYSSSKPLKTGAFYGQAAFNLNLDEPFGFSFDEGRVWGLFFAAGYTFPKLF